MKTFKVHYQVEYIVEIHCDFADLQDAITDIVIPENDSKYLDNSFEVLEVKDQ